MFSWPIAFGVFVGIALSLTGGGGSLLALPLLVYGLAITPRDAFGISLAPQSRFVERLPQPFDLATNNACSAMISPTWPATCRWRYPRPSPHPAR